jgi:hypothetical protein
MWVPHRHVPALNDDKVCRVGWIYWVRYGFGETVAIESPVPYLETMRNGFDVRAGNDFAIVARRSISRLEAMADWLLEVA